MAETCPIRGITCRQPTWFAGFMIVENDVVRLQESKRRLEMLLSYYRNRTAQEDLFVRQLEENLRGIAAVLTPAHKAQTC